MLGDIGFAHAEIRERFDPFLGTSKEKVTRKFRVTGVNLAAVKPPRAASE